MFFSEEALVDSPVERTVGRLSSWLAAADGQAAAAEALAAGGRVLARAGFAGLSKAVEVRTLAPGIRDGVTVIPIRWSATGPLGDLFPSLDANLEISAAEAGQSRMALTGSYRPPLGALGDLLDKAVLHRAGRVTIRRWLHAAGVVVTNPELGQAAARPQQRAVRETRSRFEPRPTRGQDLGGSPAPE